MPYLELLMGTFLYIGYDGHKLIKLWQTKKKQITCYSSRALWSITIISLFCVFFFNQSEIHMTI